MSAPLYSPQPSPSSVKAAFPQQTPDGFSLLPHEIFFGLALLITWARLSLVEGLFGPNAFFYLVLIATNIAGIWFSHSRGTPMSWRVSLLFYPVAMNLVFT